MLPALLACLLLQEPPPSDPSRDVHVTISAQARFSFLSGNVGLDSWDEYVMGMEDLFDSGIGFRLEAGVLFPSGPAHAFGPLLAVGRDHFRGARYTDPVGDSIEPDDLDLTCVMGGMRYQLALGGPGIVECRAGLVLAHYEAVDALFVVGGTRFPGQELFAATINGGVELAGRLALRFAHLRFEFGAGMTFLGPPRRGSDVTSRVDPTSPVEFYGDLGATVEF